MPLLMLAAIANHNHLSCRNWTPPYATFPSGKHHCDSFDQRPLQDRVTQLNIAKWLYPSERGLPWTCQVLKRHWNELPCRVLGHLLEQGVIAKIADDLYCGGNSPHELLQKWRRVLQALHKCNLRLSSSKTILNPQSTTVLGWLWNFLKQVHIVLQPSMRAPSRTR